MLRTSTLLALLPLVPLADRDASDARPFDGIAVDGRPVASRAAGALSPFAQDADDGAEEGEKSDDAEAGPRHLDELATKGLLGRFERAEHWTMQCLVLLAFGERWHPVGAAAFVRALDGREPRQRAFALEGLACADDACLAWVATPELVEVLMKKSLSDRDEYFHARVLELLARLFPDTDADDKASWRAFWRDAAETYEPAPWVAPPKKEKGGATVALGAVDRAMDLREAGLELCFCIDATGTMGPLIAATAQAARTVGELLEGFAPELRVGAVIYRDHGDLPDGAKVVAELTKRHDKVFDEIERVRAEGGGDIPEAVGAGIALAVQQKELDWSFPTNKLVIVMGDAPPHPGDVDAAAELARQAHERPLGFEARKRGSSGRTVAAAPRPFVVSCIGVGPRRVHSACRAAFETIAAAGGGTYASLAVDGDEERVRAASRDVVRHVLSMSFGERWDDEVGDFLAIYFAYLDREYFD